MAVAKLGAIVTNLAGSIGGTQFRRGRNALVVSNKSRGLSRSSALNNEGLVYMNALINAWTNASVATRDAWDVAATNYQFPDRFGTLKYLTGRQLFLKLNSNIGRLPSNLLNPATLDSGVPDLQFDDVVLEFKLDGTAVTTVDGASFGDFYIVVRYYKVQNFVAQPVFNKRKRQYAQTVTAAWPTTFDLDFTVIKEVGFPLADDTSNYWFIVQAFNLSGFPAIPRAFQVVPTIEV